MTRGYHLVAMPGNRMRIATDRLFDAVLPRQTVQLGLVRSPEVPPGDGLARAAAPGRDLTIS